MTTDPSHGPHTLPADDPLAVEVVRTIHEGDLAALEALMDEHPELARAQIATPGCDDTRSPLHIATDWPAKLPNAPRTIAALVAAGAEVGARGSGRITESPLHWAASADDVAALDALLDAGADIDADGAVIAGGTPLDDAVAFGQWNAARRLVERGATVTFRQAAALGMLDLVVTGAQASDAAELTEALWYACHGGQRETAEHLLALGAERDWVAPWDGLTPLDAAVRSEAQALVDWLRERGARAGSELV